jgi:type II secretory pathway pseudopilin PulG
MKRTSFLKTLIRSKSAETLAEVIIALTVFSLASTAIAKMVVISVNATSEGEERLVAYNLAREGVELVRNLRDTNWLRFPGNHEECWDTLNATDAAKCGTSKKLDNKGKYTVGVELTDTTKLMSLRIKNMAENPNPDDYLYAFPLETDPDMKLYTNDSSGGKETKTIYRRYIEVEKAKDNLSETSDNILTIHSTVLWEWKGQGKKIVFSSRLKNF